METLVGSTLGGYTLTRFLGSGGMGTVYLAEDKAIGQQVAIKVVRTDDGGYTDQMSETFAAERFKQEARAVASLDHLHILPFYRYGEEETASGRKAYMVMQYRPEGSLWDWVRRRTGMTAESPSRSVPQVLSDISKGWPLSVEETADYLCQAASALQYAHDRGIIHRDVKPANFLLRIDQANPKESGIFLLLSDFGLAKFFSVSSATSHVFGTPIYMAPEQFEGAASPESDQYSLAVMIYFFLAGNLPFEGDPMRLMHQHLSARVPPIRTFKPSLSAGIEAVLTRALSKQPAARYPSIQAFADDFVQRMYDVSRVSTQFVLPAPTVVTLPAQDARVSSAVPPPVTPPASQKLVQVKAPPVYPRHSAPTLYPPQHEGPIQQERISRRHTLAWLTGGALALCAGAGTGIYFYIKSQTGTQYTPPGFPGLQGNKPPNYTLLKGHTDEVTSVAWSPDGTMLASVALDHTARLWQPGNQQSTLVYQGHRRPLLSIAWNPNGTQLVSAGKDNTIQVWDTRGTLAYRYAEPATSVSDLVWTPDGRSIFFSTLGNGVREIVLEKNVVAQRGVKAIIRAIAISPDGRYLAVGADTGFIGIFTLPALSRIFYRRSHNASILSLAWSLDGAMLASGSEDNTAQVLDVKTNTLLRSLAHPGAVRGVAWSSMDRLATGATDGKMRIWSVKNGSSTTYSGHSSAINTISWGKQQIVTGSADKTIILWDA